MTKAKDTPQLVESLPISVKQLAESLGISIPIQAPFKPNDFNKLFPLFRLPLDEEAIQTSKGSETKKGYDTTGYSYMAHIDRMNEVLGPGNWTWNILGEEYDGTQANSNGYIKHIYSAEIELLIGYSEYNEGTKEWEWITVHRVPPVPTDHESYKEKGSARKGMLTKGIKRATSFIGVGADAYLGVLDEDLTTGAESEEDMQTTRKSQGKFIDSKGYIQLVELGKKKGLQDSKLREFYRVKSEGRITSDPANLTVMEAKEVKGYLYNLPDYKEPEPQPASKAEPEIEEANVPMEAETPFDKPKSLAELMAADESTIRKLAGEYSFQMPAQLTDKNKGPLCKTLGHLMGLK